MLSKIIRALTFCFLYLQVIQSHAQEDQRLRDTVTWDLESCIQYAKDNNIQINSLKLSKQGSVEDLALSKNALLPDLYGSASQSFNHYNRNAPANSTVIGASGSYGLSSSWTLYQGGYLKSDIKQKDLVVQSANLSIMEGENDISLQIATAYLNILLDQESTVYAEDLVKTSKVQLEQAKKMFGAGSIARKDVVQFEAQLAGDQYTLTSSLNAERQDKLTLKQLLQLPPEVTFDVVKPCMIAEDRTILSLGEVRAFALQNRPEVKNRELGVEIAKLSMTKAQAGYKPVITAGGSIGSSYLNGQTNNALSQINNNFNQQLGLNLSIPIFTKGVNKTNVAKARIAIDQAKLDLLNTKTVLNQTVEQAFINVQNAQTQYRSADEQLKYSQEVFRIANEELRLGAANLTDFYQQRNQYIQAYQSSIQAKYNAVLAVKIYQFYSGAPLNIK